ncbi:MAG TPA: phage tail sheath C-terminal domain-containing protein [Draconibacterium sp.]|nr:phage tail sheath C-terminal domain-containing protein [Draconibacterium sp.]
MANYKTPGVYIQEISTLPASIAGVETAIPAFIGYTERATENGDDIKLRFVATRISSLLEYEEIFGGPNNENISITVADTLDSNNVLTNRQITATLASPSSYKMYYQVQMFYNNGGGPCYILSVGSYSDTVAAPADNSVGITRGILELEKVDEPTLLVFPDAHALGSVTDYGSVISASLAHCAKLQDRFTISDVYGTDMTAFRTAIGSDNMKYGAAYYPSLNTVLNYGFSETDVNVDTHTENGGAATVDNVQGDNLSDLSASHPSLYRSILAEIKKIYVELSPCGTIVGIYARVDRERGVWKAPANVGVRSVVGPVVKITHEDQELLNVDASTGKSINALRVFTGKGTLVWGARTLAGNDNEWRYVPVRRLYIYIEESVKKATEFVVFEPNDANTWLRVKTMIENFLTTLWRDGALAGAKTEDAFFVKVGLGVTMTALDILEGRMNIEIGMAAVRPAEFIILKFSHKLQES